MDAEEIAHLHAVLGVAPGVTATELERAFMRKSFALIRGRTGAADEPNADLDAEKARLRAAYEKLAAHLQARPSPGGGTPSSRHDRGEGAADPASLEGLGSRPPAARPASCEAPPAAPAAVADFVIPDDEPPWLRFDDWRVNTFVPPLLLALTWAVTVSPLGFFLRGFHVWMHEFGHAVPSWLAGWRATPLPFGWTPVEQEHSNFVYFGLLLLLALLFVAGLKERKVWPMIAAVALAGLQAFMTWRLPEHRKEFWMVFGGVGGEFVLSTLLMLAFWVQLPEKFKWGACRYVCFILGATALVAIWTRWSDVYRGLEEIPFGSMINGEEDAAGDMNRLMDDYGWRKADIRRNYYRLGLGCWLALGVMWLAFTLRLNRLADWLVAALRPARG